MPAWRWHSRPGGLKVTAVDIASGALRIAQERIAGAFADRIALRYQDAAHLRFKTGFYPVVVAFDFLCHTASLRAITEGSPLRCVVGAGIRARLCMHG